MSNCDKVVGVLGGLGPMATVYFYEMIVNLTDAKKDQDHIDMIISNRATTPDRTEYIVGKSDKNPLDMLSADAKRLEKFGADILVIPCNTAHYFYQQLQDSINIPIINMLEETVAYVKNNNYKKVGILATNGTIKAKTYQNTCEKYEVKYEILDDENQNMLMDIIYNDIKSGKNPDMNKFEQIINYMKSNGCDCVILGCTELSILKNDYNLDDGFYIDSMGVLAKKTIEVCGKNIK